MLSDNSSCSSHHVPHHTRWRLFFPPIFVVQRDTDALPDVELAVPRLQQQRVLEVLLDHVHLALLVYEVQELSGLGGNEDAFTCGNQNGS